MTDDKKPNSGHLLGQGEPGHPAVGRGPNAGGEYSQEDYHHPAAGWGAARSVAKVLAQSRELVAGTRAIQLMNHENGGFDCPGCAWPDDRKGLHLDICENGIKHVTWEMTRKRVDRDFFANHTVTELSGWTDFALEDQGRLTEPMVYEAESDKYVPISWADAFELVGSTLRGLDSPHQASFYTSGRLSNEATFLYQLWVREFGTNNLPDCSNMCHEASGRALTASLGTGKGTCDLDDWEKADLLLVMGVNAASNAPRMLTALTEAHRRGAQIVHINPLIEAASGRTIVPHEILAMATFHATKIGTMNVQPAWAGTWRCCAGSRRLSSSVRRPTPRPSMRSSCSALRAVSRPTGCWLSRPTGPRSCTSAESRRKRSENWPRSIWVPTARWLPGVWDRPSRNTEWTPSAKS